MEAAPRQARRALALGLAAGLAGLAFAFPLPGVPEEGRRLTAVLAAVGVLWVSEALPLAATALLGPALAVLVGVAPAKAAFAALANPILVLFIGSFLLARALEKHRMSERVAYRVLSLAAVRSDPLRAFVLLGLTTAFVSAWISNTATTAMMLPIALAVLHAMVPQGGGAPPRRFAASLMLLIAYAASLGGLFTPIGTPPNLIGLGLIEQATGVRVSFGAWIARVFPVSFAALLLMMSWMAFRFRGELGSLLYDRSQMVARYAALGPWSAAQLWSAAALLLAFAGWLAPPLAGLLDPDLGRLLEARLPEGVVPLLAVAPLFLLAAGSGAERAAILELARPPRDRLGDDHAVRGRHVPRRPDGADRRRPRLRRAGGGARARGRRTGAARSGLRDRHLRVHLEHGEREHGGARRGSRGAAGGRRPAAALSRRHRGVYLRVHAARLDADQRDGLRHRPRAPVAT